MVVMQNERSGSNAEMFPAGFRAPFLWGIVASGITGYVAVWGTLKLIRTHSFLPFVVYRIIVGVLILLILASSFR